MNLNRIIVVLVVAILGLLAATTGSFAAKPGKCSPWPECKDGGDPPPPPPPPSGCTDTFPGFLYEVEATRKALAELHLASTDGCRSEFIAIVPEFRGKTFHLTADGSKGVILWSEDIENQYIVRRLDFTVNDSGVLTKGQPITVLPPAGEEALLGDYLYYRSMDIWGDATHESLYLTIRERRVFNSGPNAGTGTRVALIYDLNDLTDVTSSPDTREIYNEDGGGWQDANGLDCSSVLYPQFVPTCYGVQGLRFNPSGTRLYIPDNIDDPGGQRWDAALRIHIETSGGPTLSDWTITGPELVYTGTTEHEPGGTVARPDSNPSQLPSQEFIAMRYSDRSGNQTQVIGAILAADQCAADYAAYANGASEAQFDLWQGCLSSSTFIAGNLHGGGDSWQSPEALLKSTLDRRNYDLYQHYVTGALAGTEQLLIENARSADTGY